MKPHAFFQGNSENTRVHTPRVVLDFVDAVWPEGIALDPCGSPDALVRAERVIVPPDDGLAVEWPARTFINPPYSKLRPWLEKYLTCPEIFALVPVRTHRKWFRQAMDESQGYIWLDPLRFAGHKNTFPQPLALLYSGPRFSHVFGLCESFGDPWCR